MLTRRFSLFQSHVQNDSGPVKTELISGHSNFVGRDTVMRTALHYGSTRHRFCVPGWSVDFVERTASKLGSWEGEKSRMRVVGGVRGEQFSDDVKLDRGIIAL